MVFQTKKKYSYCINKFKVGADVVGAKLEEIEEEYGTVTNEMLLEASRDEDSETHALFEWDDSVAAEKFRLEQAHEVISNLRVEIVQEQQEPEHIDVELTDKPVEQRKTRAFVNVANNAAFKPGRYVTLNRALRDTEMRKTVLNNAIRELEVFKAKYADLEELAKVFQAIDELEEEKTT